VEQTGSAPTASPGTAVTGNGWDAVVFDVDGTLVDSEPGGHRVAFNAAFAASGLPYRWGVAEYGRLLAITGGRRRLAAYLEGRGYSRLEAAALAARLHRDKTSRMREFIGRGAIRPRPGVPELLRELSAAGVTLAVATTGARDWVEPLLEQLFGGDMFALTLTGTEVRALKPDPAVYTEALRRLAVPAERALAVEDSANGLRAALAAGLRCVVVTNDYTSGQEFSGAAAVYPGFGACLADRSGPLLGGVSQRSSS
jgi:HAD superfamily hydrolase (TIGR01509 family)